MCILAKAEERLAMVEQSRKMEEERQRMQREHEKRMRDEQYLILGKKNARPKLSFSLSKQWARRRRSLFFVPFPTVFKTQKKIMFIRLYKLYSQYKRGSHQTVDSQCSSYRFFGGSHRITIRRNPIFWHTSTSYSFRFIIKIFFSFVWIHLLFFLSVFRMAKEQKTDKQKTRGSFPFLFCALLLCYVCVRVNVRSNCVFFFNIPQQKVQQSYFVVSIDHCARSSIIWHSWVLANI